MVFVNEVLAVFMIKLIMCCMAMRKLKEIIWVAETGCYMSETIYLGDII